MQRLEKCAHKRRRNRLGGALLLLVAMAAPVQAVEVADLYQAEVSVDPQVPDERDTAYERALQQVLVRIMGSAAAVAAPQVRELFPNPARFVLQYRPAADNGLWVALDGDAIEQVLRQAGLPVWGNERPLTVVWLAVDWGRGDREVVFAEAADALSGRDGRGMRRANLRQRVQDVARQRGLPLQFPAPADLADVSFSDVWGGFHEPLIDAARRYNAASVLVGRVRPGDAQRSRWTYYAGGREQQWNGTVETALNLLADTLAEQFAVSGNNDLSIVELTIDNVRSAAAYAAVQRMIEDLQVIDGFRLKSVEGTRLRYAVRINGGAQRLSTALDFSGALVPCSMNPVAGPGDGPDVLHYAYRP